MTIRPKWFRDICSVWLSAYYLIYAQEADEKVSPDLVLHNVIVCTNVLLTASKI